MDAGWLEEEWVEGWVDECWVECWVDDNRGDRKDRGNRGPIEQDFNFSNMSSCTEEGIEETRPGLVVWVVVLMVVRVVVLLVVRAVPPTMRRTVPPGKSITGSSEMSWYVFERVERRRPPWLLLPPPLPRPTLPPPMLARVTTKLP